MYLIVRRAADVMPKTRTLSNDLSQKPLYIFPFFVYNMTMKHIKRLMPTPFAEVSVSSRKERNILSRDPA